MFRLCRRMIVNALSLILLLMVLVTIPSTYAVSRHGLYWAVEEGDTFSFHLDIFENETNLVSETIVLKVTELPNLNTTLEYQNRIPLILYEVTWVNGTDLGDYNQWNYYVEHLAYPLGNWVYVTESITADMSDYELISTEDFWGYEWTIIVGPQSILQYTVRAVFSTNDGFLTRYLFIKNNTETGQVLGLVDAYRLDIEFDYRTLAINASITVIIGLLIIIGIRVIWNKRKR